MLVKEDGRIDRSVLRYFEQVGRSTIQSVAQAMRSGELRDDEMMQLTQVAVQSMGRNDPQGDSLFRDTGDSATNIRWTSRCRPSAPA